MNKDDFIYRLRPQPPPEFAARLKAKLDRQAAVEPASRRWVGWPLILGILIGGLTFAAVAFLGLHLRPGEPGSAARPDLTTLSARPMSPAPTPRPHAGEQPEASTGVVPRPATGTTVIEGSRATSAAETGTRGGESASDAADQAPPALVVYDASGSASPQEIARQAVDTRQGLFRVLGWATAKPIEILVGHRQFDADELLKYAVRIEQLAPMIKDVYRLDTRSSGIASRSLDSIWDRKAEFDAMADDLRVVAANVAVAARTGEQGATMKAFKRLAEDCYRCHDKYRVNGER